MKLLLDEMYPKALAVALREERIDAVTVAELGLAGSSDDEIFAVSVGNAYVILTENVADFVHISADHVAAGRHHPGVLIALSTRFSRRPAGISGLVDAVRAVVTENLGDRVVYLETALEHRFGDG